MSRVSSHDIFTKMAVVDIDAAAVAIAMYQPGQYVACIYDHIGNVVEIAEEVYLRR